MAEVNKKPNNSAVSLMDNNYIEIVKKDLADIINTDDRKRAFDMAKSLKEAVDKNRELLAKNKDIFEFYKKVIIKARFIALPMLDEIEVLKLMKNYFTWHYNIPFYDLEEKFKFMLIGIPVHENRDVLKEKVKKVLLENKEIITSQAEIRSISEWLRDYNSKLGIGLIDSLKRREYLVNLTKIKGVEKDDIEKLKILFSFYESLKVSSMSPEGYEEDQLVKIEDKLYIFKQGKLELLLEEKEEKAVSEESKSEREEVGQPPRPVDSVRPQKSAQPRPQPTAKATQTQPTVKRESRADELKAMAAKYPEGSLERKAIEEQIKKMG